MAAQGIFKPFRDKATDWCSPIIVVQQPGGEVKICVDLSKLNKFVKTPTHPGASPTEAVSGIPLSEKYVSTINAVKGYW